MGVRSEEFWVRSVGVSVGLGSLGLVVFECWVCAWVSLGSGESWVCRDWVRER